MYRLPTQSYAGRVKLTLLHGVWRTCEVCHCGIMTPAVMDLAVFAPLFLGLVSVTLAMCVATRKRMLPDIKAS